MSEPKKGSGIILLVTRDGMGEADQALRHKLINAYFDLLLANGRLPDCILFYADGVKLTVEGSPVLEVLEELANNGVQLRSCGTCLNHFELTGKLRVGEVGDMQSLIERQWGADKVITL